MRRISVVIPTLNRACTLARAIDCIEHQTVDRDAYEVLVIDNNSSDDTQRVLSEKHRTFSNLRVFRQAKPGAAATRNVGIREASGEIILFIDDDIFAASDLIESHLKYYGKQSRVSVIGRVDSQWSESTDPFLRYLRDRGMFNPYSLAHNRPIDFSFFHTGNVSTSRRLLQEVGGFSEEFCVYGMEDIELGYRLEKSGCRMIPGVSANARHEYFPTYHQFIGRCQQAGYSLGKLIELHPELQARFMEKGRRRQALNRFQSSYRILRSAWDPFCRGLIAWESRRGTGKVNVALERHYYWAIRYHFFLGLSEYVRSAGDGKVKDSVDSARESQNTEARR